MERLGRIYPDGEYGLAGDETKVRTWLFRALEEGKRIVRVPGGASN